MAFNYSPKPVIDSSLVLYLDAANSKSYISGSTTWNDVSRGGNNGTLVSGSMYNPTNGGAILLTGYPNYVSVPYNASLGLSSQGTVNIWCYPASLPQYPYAGLVGMTINGSNNGQSYYIHWRNVSSVIQAAIQNNGTYNTISIPVPTTIAWYNFTFTWNGSFLNLYQNGVSAATPVAQTINAQALNSEIAVGGKMFGVDGNIAGYFTGYIPITQIYNRALSSSEVLQNYNATKTRYGL